MADPADGGDVFRGLFMTSIATVAMSAALFSRKNKAGWLDELDGIRGDALVSPSGGTAAVMGEVSSLADTGLESGPIEWRDSAELAAELDRWRTGVQAPNPEVTAAPELTTAPELVDAPELVSAPASAPATSPAPPIRSAEPAPTAGPVAAAPSGPGSAVAAGDAPQLPPPPVVVRPDLPPPPAPAAAGPELLLPPPPPASVAPAPHRAYPAEMWHPDVMAPSEPEPEVVVDAATEVVDEAEPPRFRFAALRTVEPLGSDRQDTAVPTDLTPAITEVPAAAPVAPPAGQAELTAAPVRADDVAALAVDPPAHDAPVPGGADAYGSVAAYLGPADEPDTAMTATVAEIAAPDWTTPPDVPLVPEPTPGVGGALITGPVARRTRRSDEARDGADRSITLPGGMRGIADGSEQPVSRVLPVGQDGTVTLNAGLLRISPSVPSEVRLDSGRVRLELAAGWCWTTLGLDADPVTVLLPNGSVAMAAGTTALVSVEDDGTTFVVVANGAAVLVEPFGSTMLAGSTVALVPVGCSPQVDAASFAEIEAEPLVASNRALDAGR